MESALARYDEDERCEQFVFGCPGSQGRCDEDESRERRVSLDEDESRERRDVY